MLKDYTIVKTVDGALASLGQGNARVIAGGTDLMIDLESGKIKVDRLVDINNIAELKKVELVDGQIRIGAAVTHQEVAQSSLIKERALALADASRTVGSLQIRNTATVVGNVINAQPAADAAVALIAFGAVAEIQDATGVTYQPVEELYAGVGNSKVDSGSQLVTAVQFPALLANQGSAFVRLAQRKALALPMLNVAVVASLVENKVEWVRIVMAPVDIKPVRATSAEELLKGAEANEVNILAAAQEAAAKANPRSSGLRGSAEYRKSVLVSLVKRGLTAALLAAGENN